MNITNILSTILYIMMTCVIVVYYSNSVMNYRHSRFESNIVIIIGYTVYAVISLLGHPVLNIISGIIILFVVLFLGFSDNIGNIVLKVIILSLLSMVSELTSGFIFNVDVDTPFNQNITVLENIIYTLLSILIFYICVVLLKLVSVKRDKRYKMHNMLYFLALPISTVMLLYCLGGICSLIKPEQTVLLLSATLAFIISNFVVYVVYDKFVDNVLKTEELKRINYKEQLDYAAYELMKDKYADLKIMIHNFEKYCTNIEGMLGDNAGAASDLINTLKDENKKLLLVEYTNNTALNVLLFQKMEQCNKENINLQLYIQDIDLSFIDEFDIVAIFSNLLDNAIESCKQSIEKNILLRIYTANDAYVVVNVDNSSDTVPIVHNGVPKTHKKNKEEHGMGMVSIQKSISKYGGNMRWKYDNSTKRFNTTIIINFMDCSAKI